METEYINRVIRLTLLCATLSSPLVGSLTSFSDALGILLGAIWGCSNLLYIKKIVTTALGSCHPQFAAEGRAPETYKKQMKIVSMLAIKFPILYFAGYQLMASEYFSIWSLMVGFSLIFGAILLCALRPAAAQKVALCFAVLLSTAPLSAGMDLDVPEVPTFISLLIHTFQGSYWAEFLHYWDSLIFSLLAAIGISLIFHFGTRKAALIPTPFQNALEWLVETLRHYIVEILGPQGEKFVPLLGTLFLYILTMNWFGLVPFMKSPSSDLNVTVALALTVFIIVQYQNIRNYGPFGFLYHLAGSPKGIIGWCMVPMLFCVELLTQLTRPLTLALRLFGNVFGEETLIGVFALFGVLMLSSHLPVGLPLQIPFMFLALLTGLMQALVFTLLSTIYLLLSIPNPEDHSLDGM